MQLDGYRLELNNTTLIFTKIEDKIKGKERPCDQTPIWKQATYYIDFYSSKEQRADKIPLRKSVKALEKKLEENKTLNRDDLLSLGVISAKVLDQPNAVSNSDSGKFSQGSSEANSLASISSTSSKEKIEEQQKKATQLATSTIDFSRTSHTPNLFTDKMSKPLVESKRIKQIYTDKYKQTIDLVLSETDSFLARIAENRKKPAISFRQCVRVENVTQKEMLCLKASSQQKTMQLGKR